MYLKPSEISLSPVSVSLQHLVRETNETGIPRSYLPTKPKMNTVKTSKVPDAFSNASDLCIGDVTTMPSTETSEKHIYNLCLPCEVQVELLQARYVFQSS